MSRSRSSLADDLLAIGAKLSPPLAAASAVVAWAIFHGLAELSAPSRTARTDVLLPLLAELARALGSVLQYVVPALLVAGAVVALLRRRRERQWHDDVTAGTTPLEEISWQDFEALVAGNFRRLGFEVERAGGAQADGGVDLVLCCASERYLVQCKHWRARRVGVAIVRELYGVMAARDAVGAFVVTSGSFTPEAEAFAAGREIQLVDARKLLAESEPKAPGPLPARTRARPHRGITLPFPAVDTVAGIDLDAARRREPELRSLTCDRCGAPMIRRVARSGMHAGREFFGCTRFPACRNIHPL